MNKHDTRTEAGLQKVVNWLVYLLVLLTYVGVGWLAYILAREYVNHGF